MSPVEHDCITELKTDMAEIKADLRNLLSRLSGYVPEHCIAHTERINQLQGEITAIKSAQIWLWRTIATAIIAGGTIPLIRLIF